MATVLVIEDNKIYRDVLRLQIASLGHSVLEAEEGGTALHWFSREQVDAVVLDLNLPGIKGDDLLDHIRRQDLQVPVLILTGSDELERAVNLMRRGAFCFLSKPVSRDQLQAELDRALEIHRLSREKTKLEKMIRPYREEVRRVAAQLEHSRSDHTLSLLGCRLELEAGECSEATLASLEQRFDWVESVLRKEGGDSHQFLGNEVLAIFGSKNGCHPLQAARASWEIHQHLGAQVQLGLHCGPVRLSGHQVDYSGVDDLILTMCLLLCLTSQTSSGVLLSEPLFQAVLPEGAQGRAVGWVPVRNGPREVRTYELLGLSVS